MSGFPDSSQLLKKAQKNYLSEITDHIIALETTNKTLQELNERHAAIVKDIPTLQTESQHATKELEKFFFPHQRNTKHQWQELQRKAKEKIAELEAERTRLERTLGLKKREQQEHTTYLQKIFPHRQKIDTQQILSEAQTIALPPPRSDLRPIKERLSQLSFDIDQLEKDVSHPLNREMTNHLTLYTYLDAFHTLSNEIKTQEEIDFAAITAEIAQWNNSDAIKKANIRDSQIKLQTFIATVTSQQEILNTAWDKLSQMISAQPALQQDDYIQSTQEEIITQLQQLKALSQNITQQQEELSTLAQYQKQYNDLAFSTARLLRLEQELKPTPDLSHLHAAQKRLAQQTTLLTELTKDIERKKQDLHQTILQTKAPLRETLAAEFSKLKTTDLAETFLHSNRVTIEAAIEKREEKLKQEEEAIRRATEEELNHPNELLLSLLPSSEITDLSDKEIKFLQNLEKMLGKEIPNSDLVIIYHAIKPLATDSHTSEDNRFSFIHTQKNPTFDSLRLSLARRPPNTPWQTATAQKAIESLQRKFLANYCSGDSSALPAPLGSNPNDVDDLLDSQRGNFFQNKYKGRIRAEFNSIMVTHQNPLYRRGKAQ